MYVSAVKLHFFAVFVSPIKGPTTIAQKESQFVHTALCRETSVIDRLIVLYVPSRCRTAEGGGNSSQYHFCEGSEAMTVDFKTLFDGLSVKITFKERDRS